MTKDQIDAMFTEDHKSLTATLASLKKVRSAEIESQYKNGRPVSSDRVCVAFLATEIKDLD